MVVTAADVFIQFLIYSAFHFVTDWSPSQPFLSGPGERIALPCLLAPDRRIAIYRYYRTDVQSTTFFRRFGGDLLLLAQQHWR